MMRELLELVPPKQLLMVVVLGAALFFVIRSLLRKSNDDTSQINLDDLLLEYDATGRARMSIIRVLALGAFTFTIWMMVSLTLAGKMTEGYFTIFCGVWATPLTASIIWGKKPPAGPAINIERATVENKQ